MGTYISIDNGFPGDGALKFYVRPPELGIALESDLRDAGVATDRILEHSDMAHEVLVVAVAFTGAGGLKHLAHLLEVFVHRNDGKRITLKANGEISSSGLTVDDIEEVLKACTEKQRTIDEDWRQRNSAKPVAGDPDGPQEDLN